MPDQVQTHERQRTASDLTRACMRLLPGHARQLGSVRPAPPPVPMRPAHLTMGEVPSARELATLSRVDSWGVVKKAFSPAEQPPCQRSSGQRGFQCQHRCTRTQRLSAQQAGTHVGPSSANRPRPTLTPLPLPLIPPRPSAL